MTGVKFDYNNYCYIIIIVFIKEKYVMIFDISNIVFKNIFHDEKFYLPIRWSGDDYLLYLDNLLNKYCLTVEMNYELNDGKNLVRELERICGLLKKCVEHYFNGFPAEAYNSFTELMSSLMNNPLKVYKKNVYEILEGYNDNLNLFRVACTKDNIKYDRKRLFHTPYNLRSKVATCRYSIAGYPSLYLGTNLELCCEEVQYNPHFDYGLASRFQIERSIEYNDTKIDVIELAVKPQDFINDDVRSESFGRRFDEIDLKDTTIRRAYLLWYPLIAACSFIRANKNDPFAAEYIVPQLLMQWIRFEMMKKQELKYDRLIGIRYFSCASERASDLGFNYVFPVSGKQYSSQYPFCPVLMKAFRMTKPYYINEYDELRFCERAMKKDKNLTFVNN